jgi:hypothetical protein
MTATPDARTEPVTPLEAARAWAGRALAIAQHYEIRDQADPGMGALEAHIHGAGKAQFEAAQMASFMALVSIADDVHAIAAMLLTVEAEIDQEEP